MSQAEGQQKNLVHSIDSLPTKGPVSCLDHDLLLLKATSAATLSCLGECLNILQQSQGQPLSKASQPNHTILGAQSGESAPGPIPTLLLEPPTPTSPFLSPASSQSTPQGPNPSDKGPLAELDCGPCPYLLGSVNLGVCGKCCWMLSRSNVIFEFDLFGFIYILLLFLLLFVC